MYTFTCFRSLDTGDAEDYLIEVNKEFPIIWAEKTDGSALQYHSARGESTLTLSDSGEVAEVGEEVQEAGPTTTGTERRDYFFKHGLIMWSCWNLFAFV